jgi:hypothetical protein
MKVRNRLKFQKANLALLFILLLGGCSAELADNPADPRSEDSSDIESSEGKPAKKKPKEAPPKTKPLPDPGKAPPPPSPGPAESPQTQPARVVIDWGSALGLRVVPSTAESDLLSMPDLHYNLRNTSSLSDSTIQGMEIHMHGKFHLKDSRSVNRNKHKDLYFVWPEEIANARVSYAQFSIRVQTADGRTLGRLRPIPAWHDSDRHRWYIPMAELYREFEDYSYENVSLLDTQILDLDVTLEGGIALTYHIRFQIAGPFPQPAIAAVDLPAPSSLQTVVQSVVNTGWTLKKEQISNPTQRDFKVWVRVLPGNSPILMETFLKYPKYEGRPNKRPLGPTHKKVSSKGSMEVSQVEVKHQDGTVETFPMNSGIQNGNTQTQGWASFVLKGSETVTLSWIGKPSQQASRCTVPAEQNQTFTWAKIPKQTYHWEPHPEVSKADWPAFVRRKHHLFGLLVPVPERRKVPDPLPPPVIRTKQYPIRWSISGAQIYGDWIRELRLSHIYAQERQVIQEAGTAGASDLPIDYSPMGSQSQPVRLIQGSIPASGHGTHNCQGFLNP